MKLSILALALISPMILAAPKQEYFEVYQGWSVTKNLTEYEYWASGSLDNDYKLAFIASRDVVGPGCTLNKLAILSDTMLLPKQFEDRPIIASIWFGENLISGKLIQSDNRWSSAYGVVAVANSKVDEAIHRSYVQKSKSIGMILTQDGKSIVDGGGQSSGMYNAYKRAIDLCRLDRARDEVIDAHKASKSKYTK